MPEGTANHYYSDQHHADVMEIINVDDFDESELIRVAYKKPRAKKAKLMKVG